VLGCTGKLRSARAVTSVEACMELVARRKKSAQILRRAAPNARCLLKAAARVVSDAARRHAE
jgi:hypothetical protein